MGGEVSEKNGYVRGERYQKKNVYVRGERGYLSRTSRPRNAFSPPHPLRCKTGNAFLPKTYKLADYQQFI